MQTDTAPIIRRYLNEHTFILSSSQTKRASPRIDLTKGGLLPLSRRAAIKNVRLGHKYPDARCPFVKVDDDQPVETLACFSWKPSFSEISREARVRLSR